MVAMGLNMEKWIHKWIVLYIFCLSMPLTSDVILREHVENGKVLFSLKINDPPIIGQNMTFSCLIFNKPNWKMSWSKNSGRSLTSCTNTFCTADRTQDGKYLFSTNKSGIFMSLNFLNSQDAGIWKCRRGRSYLIYNLEETNMIYPPSSCVLTSKETSFHCFSPCIKADENFTMKWRFQDNSLQEEYITSVPSDCDHHKSRNKNMTFKNYTGIIKQKQGGQFKGEGQLTCTCGIDGHSTTVVESSSLQAYFYDCSFTICIAVTTPITVVLIAIINGIMYLRNKKTGYLAFIKQWRCMIITKWIFELLILVLVIAICWIKCITETWKVIIRIILLPVSYTICCLIAWCPCTKQALKKGENLILFGVSYVKKNKREMDNTVKRNTSPRVSKKSE